MHRSQGTGDWWESVTLWLTHGHKVAARAMQWALAVSSNQKGGLHLCPQISIHLLRPQWRLFHCPNHRDAQNKVILFGWVLNASLSPRQILWKIVTLPSWKHRQLQPIPKYIQRMINNIIWHLIPILIYVVFSLPRHLPYTVSMTNLL